MSVRGRRFCALPALFLFALPAGAAVPPKPDPAAVDVAVRDALKAWGVPGASVAVVRDGEVAYLKGHGVREAGRNQPVTPDTVFPLASCTKGFTTAVMAMLVDEGKLSWDDPVRKYLDWFHLSDPLADRDVTLRDLVTHRTGLRGHDMLWYRSPHKQEDIIRRLALLPLDHPFRTTFQYQSTMFTTAGLAAGAATKSTWADLVRTRLLVPLKMTGASLTTTEAAKAPDRAMPHRTGPDGRPQVIDWYPQETPDAAGSLNASASDLTKWLMFQLNEGRYGGKRLVSAEALRETHAPQIVLRDDGISRDLNPETNLSSYGMAWRIQDYRGTLMLSHAGAIDGFRAEIMLFPKERVGVALLCNLHQSRINLALGNTLADLFLGLPKKDWDGYFLGVVKKEQKLARQEFVKRWGEPDPDRAPSLALAKYEGVYEHPAYGQARVSLEDGGLVLRWSSFKWPLAHYRGDTFLIREDYFGQTCAKFAVGAKGVTALTLGEPIGVDFKLKSK